MPISKKMWVKHIRKASTFPQTIEDSMLKTTRNSKKHRGQREEVLVGKTLWAGVFAGSSRVLAAKTGSVLESIARKTGGLGAGKPFLRRPESLSLSLIKELRFFFWFSSLRVVRARGASAFAPRSHRSPP